MRVIYLIYIFLAYQLTGEIFSDQVPIRKTNSTSGDSSTYSLDLTFNTFSIRENVNINKGYSMKNKHVKVSVRNYDNGEPKWIVYLRNGIAHHDLNGDGEFDAKTSLVPHKTFIWYSGKWHSVGNRKTRFDKDPFRNDGINEYYFNGQKWTVHKKLD